MADQFIAEIRIFAGNFAPTGWAFCDGQILPISQNTALFSLLGTMYGGDGKTNFALPNLQGSAPMQAGQGNGLTDRIVGESGGEPYVTLLESEIPAHSHAVQCSSGTASLASPTNNVWAAAGRGKPGAYTSSSGNNTPMSPLAVTQSGGSQPHNNMPPYLALTFIIALQGIFPSRS